MKKFLIEITDEAHDELLKLQLEKKLKKEKRATVKEVAGDYLSYCLEERAKKESPGK